jgi:hypothetical protein
VTFRTRSVPEEVEWNAHEETSDRRTEPVSDQNPRNNVAGNPIWFFAEYAKIDGQDG